jgi:hypothetical protein
MVGRIVRPSLNRGSPSAFVAAVLGKLLTTRGDLLTRDASTPVRLPIGAAGTLLRSDGTDAAWGTVATALATILTTRGQIIRRGASAPEALAAQTINTFLGGDGTDIAVRTVAQVLTSLGIAVSTYTPTLTNTTNIDSSTANTTYYANIANLAFAAWGIVGIDCTAAASTASDMGMSLPIASALTASTQIGGSATAADLPSSIRITADATNDRARFQWSSQSASNLNFGFIFGGPILA